MTITEFLTARWDEEEAMALGVKHLPPVHPEFIAPDVGAIIIDPDRFLADIAAKRALLEWLDRIDQEAQQEGLERYWLAGDFDTAPARLALAQPYAGHKDFDPEWRV